MERGPISRRGLTHETFYDLHGCLRGFLNVLKDMDKRHPNGYKILARKFCSDCIESLFGKMRQANGGNRDLSIRRVVELARVLQVDTTLDTSGYNWILLDTTGYYWILLGGLGYSGFQWIHHL